MFKKKNKKTQDSLNKDRARIRPSPCLNYSAIGLSFSLHRQFHAEPLLPPYWFCLLVCLGGNCFHWTHEGEKGKDSGEISQRPAPLAGLATLFSSPSFHNSLRRSRSRHKSLFAPLGPLAQSDSSLVTQPKTTGPVVSSTFSGRTAVLLPRQN